VYKELRDLAARLLAREQSGQTLQATALVHEVYLRLVGGNGASAWNSRGHFFAAAAEAMRRILVERARHKHCLRREGRFNRLALDQVDLPIADREQELLFIHEVLDQFATDHPEKAALVKLRYFAGLSSDEAASVLGISPSTADRYWSYSRAWLYREFSRETSLNPRQ
jgi:RNA polymerase sigma factor (TIGR02999 family)